MTTVHTDNAPAAIGPYSQAIIHGDTLYTSGQIPVDPATGEVVGTTIEEQADRVMKNLGAVLEAAGTSYEKAVKTVCFLADMNDFAVSWLTWEILQRLTKYTANISYPNRHVPVLQ